MNSKKIVIHRLASVIGALVLSATCLQASAQDKLQIAGNFATSHPSSVAVEKIFKAEVARLTNNTLQVDVFPAMQLGGAKENVDGVRAGTLGLTWVGAAFMSRIAPEIEAVSLPFVFKNRESAYRVIDGPVGKAIDQKLLEKGFVVLGWMELGMRHVTNSKGPIKSVDDLKGMKIRMQPNETHLASFRALGANPIAMDVKELYSALEQKVVDGQENPYTVINANRFAEVQRHLSNSSHFFDFIVVVASKRVFDKMSPANQIAVRQAMAKTVAYQRSLAAEDEKKALDNLKTKMTYTEIPPETFAKMRELTAPVVDSVKKRAGADLVNQVLAETSK